MVWMRFSLLRVPSLFISSSSFESLVYFKMVDGVVLIVNRYFSSPKRVLLVGLYRVDWIVI